MKSPPFEGLRKETKLGLEQINRMHPRPSDRDQKVTKVGRPGPDASTRKSCEAVMERGEEKNASLGLFTFMRGQLPSPFADFPLKMKGSRRLLLFSSVHGGN